jgi:hypothetical protein
VISLKSGSDEMESIYIENYHFNYIGNIIPDQAQGEVRAYFPQDAYANVDELPLHEYGAGPFCHFQIPKIHAQGVYLIRVNTVITYVGECEDLSNRFNAGYGNISPRNCFVGGQPTNCRLNHNIYKRAKNNDEIVLYFHETENRFQVESELIDKLNPEWNISRGKHRSSVPVHDHAERSNINSRGRNIREAGMERNESKSNRRTNCRDEVVSAVRSVVKERGVNRFTVNEVVDYMLARKTSYSESTIRTHVTSRCCINAPNHHATIFNDFERVERGVYRIYKLQEVD